jgi:hypothetical protein
MTLILTLENIILTFHERIIFNKKLIEQFKRMKEKASTLEKNLKTICTQKDVVKEQVDMSTYMHDSKW